MSFLECAPSSCFWLGWAEMTDLSRASWMITTVPTPFYQLNHSLGFFNSVWSCCPLCQSLDNVNRTFCLHTEEWGESASMEGGRALFPNHLVCAEKAKLCTPKVMPMHWECRRQKTPVLAIATLEWCRSDLLPGGWQQMRRWVENTYSAGTHQVPLWMQTWPVGIPAVLILPSMAILPFSKQNFWSHCNLAFHAVCFSLMC